MSGKNVEERGEELTPRDHRLNDDVNYREMLETERERVDVRLYDYVFVILRFVL